MVLTGIPVAHSTVSRSEERLAARRGLAQIESARAALAAAAWSVPAD